MATGRRIIGGSPLAFGEGGVKGRIKNVLNFKKPSRVIIIAVTVLAVVLSAGFAVNRAMPVAGGKVGEVNPVLPSGWYEHLDAIRATREARLKNLTEAMEAYEKEAPSDQ